MEALRVDIEQSKEPRMSARRDGGAVVRVERRRHWSDEEKLAILKETTQPGAIMAVVARRYGIGPGQPLHWRKHLHPTRRVSGKGVAVGVAAGCSSVMTIQHK